MVLGEPGAGKSTFLKRIGLAALQGKEDRILQNIYQNLPNLKSDLKLPSSQHSFKSEELYSHEVFPVLIELKNCINDKIDLIHQIQKELDIFGFERTDTLTQTLLNNGGMLILLDGLDEVPSQHFDRVFTQIQNFANKYKHNRFIISCRTAAYKGGFNKLVNIEIADFDDKQIQQFIDKWFYNKSCLDTSVANECWQLLNTDDYKLTKELAHTPLLLTFLCIVYDESRFFPKNRASLYKKALDILLERWAAEKRIQRQAIYKDLTIELEEMLLAEIAYEQFSQDKVFFEKREIILKIRKYLEENL
jgi:predicted NACHT family NTPase